jgi:hypothetical protein
MTKGRGKTPGFGGLDKHIKREAHKERAQLPSRARLGQLEKHKDYVKRAKRRHDKVKKLTELKRAAAHRNPDEFNIKMTQRVLDRATGKMKVRKATTAAAERGKELTEGRKGLAYLAHKEATDHRRVMQIYDDVVGLDAAPRNTHTVFVDDEDAVATFDPVQHFHTTKEMLRTPATRVNLKRVAHIQPLADDAEEDDRAALQATLASAPEDGHDNGGDEVDDFATRLTAARADVARDRRRKELEARRGAAMRMREAAERRRRETQLHALASTLRSRTNKLAEKQKRKQSAKYRPGTSVRQR